MLQITHGYKRNVPPVYTLVQVLQRSVDMHQLELAKLLRGKPEPLRFIVETEDFPMVWKHPHPKLPAFSMCAEPAAIDIPVPDFTFGEEWESIPSSRGRGRLSQDSHAAVHFF